MSRVIGRKWRRLSKYVCLLGLMSIVLWTFYVKIVRRDYADRSVIPITIVEEHHEGMFADIASFLYCEQKLIITKLPFVDHRWDQLKWSAYEGSYF